MVKTKVSFLKNDVIIASTWVEGCFDFRDRGVIAKLEAKGKDALHLTNKDYDSVGLSTEEEETLSDEEFEEMMNTPWVDDE